MAACPCHERQNDASRDLERKAFFSSQALYYFDDDHPFIEEVEHAKDEGLPALRKAAPQEIHLDEADPWAKWPESRRPTAQFQFALRTKRRVVSRLQKLNDPFGVPT